VYATSKDKVPVELSLDKETFEKSRLYGIDKNYFSMFSDFFAMSVLTVRKLIGNYCGQD
jgi:hypothetical protein